jgi:hypothetical protein
MRRLLVILGVVGALAAPVSAQATTTVEHLTFDTTFPLCNGDLIHVSGPLLAVISETAGCDRRRSSDGDGFPCNGPHA